MYREQFSNFSEDHSSSDLIDVDKVLAVIKRQWKIAALGVVVSIVLGLLYLLTAVPLYTAGTTIIIDRNNKKIADQLSALDVQPGTGGYYDDEAFVLSQVEIMQSQRIALAVVDKLDLLNNADFMADDRSLLAKTVDGLKSTLDFRNWFSSSDESDWQSTEDEDRQYAAQTLLSNLSVLRVGQTYVLGLSYTSSSPVLSAHVANAFADAYLNDQLDAKYDTTRRASAWMQKRIDELRKKALVTDMAVQKFKSDKGLISTGGELISDQQLSLLNSQLIAARAETASAKAKYDRIENILERGQMDASVTDSLDSSVINELQGKYLDASKLAADITSRLGANHLQAVRLRTEMQEYKRLMFEELSRIAETYNSTYRVALARQKDIESQVTAATNMSSNANDDLVQLRELQREADTYKVLYENFLQRFQEVSQQQSFPVTEARVISTADVPQFPSAPRKVQIMALFAMLGVIGGGAAGIFREYKDRYFRTGEQVRDELGLEYLGQVPLETRVVIQEGNEAVKDESGRFLNNVNTVSSYVVDHPLSIFAETLRSAKIAADVFSPVQSRARVIGIVSSLPREGKSTIAVNFAQLLASQGARTLLIDADLRNPGATRAIASHARKGLLEYLDGSETLQNRLFFDPKTRLAFLPAAVKTRIPHSAEFLSSPRMSELLTKASSSFDYIIVDLPPMGAVVDARAFATHVDSYIVVVEWGHTARKLVRVALEHNEVIAKKSIGVLLNKVDTSKLNLYMDQEQNYYFNTRYSAYYTDESAVK